MRTYFFCFSQVNLLDSIAITIIYEVTIFILFHCILVGIIIFGKSTSGLWLELCYKKIFESNPFLLAIISIRKKVNYLLLISVRNIELYDIQDSLWCERI